MVEALIFWALALYGAMMVVYQSVAAIMRRMHVANEIIYYVIVHNGEDHIEGILRTMMLRAWFGQSKRSIVVIDVGSTDDTTFIVMKMAQKHHCIEYILVEEESSILDILALTCSTSGAVSCIYDLRHTKHQYSQLWHS